MKKANFVLGVVNLLAMTYIIFRFGIPYYNSTQSLANETDSIGVFLSAQANQFALLQTYLSTFGIGLALAAFWGYIEITTRAEQKAEATVQGAVPKLFNELLDKFGREELNRLLDERMKKSSQKNTDDVLQEGIERMFKDPMDVDKTYE